MEEMFGLLMLVGGGSIAYLLYWFRSQQRAAAWQEAAKAAGLTNVTSPTFLGVERNVTGQSRGLDVKIGSYRRGKHEHGTRIEIGGLRHGTYRLSLRAEGVTSAIEKTFGEREIEVGDPAFDDVAFLQGEPALIRAVFDADTRRLMTALLSGNLTADGPGGEKRFSNIRVVVSDNELRVDIRSSLFDQTEAWLPALLPQLVAIGQRLRRPDDVPERLAANAREDRVEAVRLACLKALTSEFRDHNVTRDALAAALAEDNAEVRLFAATNLGPDGRQTLVALASERQHDTVSARAVSALGQAFPIVRAVERLAQARADGHDETAVACIEVLGGSGDASVADAVAASLSAGEAVAVAAARALGAGGQVAAEAPLVAALGHEAGAVRVAVADALGRLGTAAAVAPLREASESHLLDGDLRRAVRQAIAEIKSRVTGASPGQLSLAAGDPGQLTLVEGAERGRVSLEQMSEPRAGEDQVRRAAQAASRTRQAERR